MTVLSTAADFDSAALSGGRRIDVGQWLTDEPILGLVRESGYVWGTVRSEDGRTFSYMRRMPFDTGSDSAAADTRSLAGKLVVLESDRNGMKVDKTPKHAVDSSELDRSGDGDAMLIASKESAVGQPLRLRMSPTEVHYRESGVLDLAGELAVPGMQWFLPGPRSALLYLTQTWHVSGTILGHEVTGFLFYEEAYMYPESRLYVTNDPLHDAEYFTWYSWANRWDDGTTEVGHFLVGDRRFHVGVIADSTGSVRSAKTMSAKVSRDSDGYWHDGLQYSIDGEDWVCEARIEGRMHLGSIPNPQQEGYIHRLGEKRVPLTTMAWGETVPSRDDREGAM